MRMGYTWGSAPIDPFTFPHTSGITPTVSAKHLLCASFVFDFPQYWPPHLHLFDWPVPLPLLEDYLKGCEVTDLYRFLLCFTLLPNLSHFFQPPVSLHSPHCTVGRVAAAVHLCLPLWSLLRSVLAISGRPITLQNRTLSRRVTNLAQHARAPVALSGGIRKN